MPLGGHRTDTWRATIVLIDSIGRLNLGTWDKKTGGAVDSESLVYYPGGMEDPEQLGGRRTTENVTMSTRYGVERFDNLMPRMLQAVGRAHVDLHVNPLDNDGKPYGRPFNMNGILKRLGPPEVDNEGGSAAMLELEVSIIGFPTMGDKNNAS